LQVRAVPAKELFELRRRVLRGDDPGSSVQDPRDGEATTRHFAGFLNDRVVASASFFSARPPINPDLVSYQLRYMAIDFDVQGRGYGTVLVDTALAELRAQGAQQVWAKARDSALGFYQSTGWSTLVGSEHVSLETQLPHTVIFRLLSGATPSGAAAVN
jgi:GNAT superfamily N-acetyltransferase